MYPHVFHLHWLNGTCRIFNMLHYFVELMENGTGGPCDLKWLGETMLIKQGSFLYLEEKQLYKA